MSVTRENIVSTNEKNNHLKYIKEHKDMDKVVYKYTQSSLELRKSPSKMKKLNNLIKNAPLLKKEYTVYNMKSDYDKVLRIDGKNLENSNEIEADELVVGDIFTQESLWDTDKDKQNNILSTTYDRNYPLTDFSKDLSTKYDKDFVDMFTFDTVEKMIKVNNCEQDQGENLKNIYEGIKEYVEQYSKENDENLKDIDISTFREWIIYDSGLENKKSIKNSILKLSNKIIELKNGCACCLFRIRLKNKKGLLVEKISAYPDQKEILLQDPTFMIVRKVSTEKYKTIPTLERYKQKFKTNFIYDFDPDKDQEYEEKNIKVYDVDVIYIPPKNLPIKSPRLIRGIIRKPQSI